MKDAKNISFIAFISNSLLSAYSLNIFLKLSSIFKDLEMQTPFPWFLLVSFIFVVGSLTYWFYLKNKEKKGEKVKFALLISIILLLIPVLVMPAIVARGVISPIYDLLGSF